MRISAGKALMVTIVAASAIALASWLTSELAVRWLAFSENLR